MYTALNVARYIIERCNLRNRSISNLKLQKILYFVQAEFLVARGEPCFVEPIEAWDFGPVVPDVYQTYKVYGSSSIPLIGKMINSHFITEEDQELIDEIVDECSKYSASSLVEITHHQAPWVDAYQSGRNNIITRQSIEEYFAEE